MRTKIMYLGLAVSLTLMMIIFSICAGSKSLESLLKEENYYEVENYCKKQKGEKQRECYKKLADALFAKADYDSSVKYYEKAGYTKKEIYAKAAVVYFNKNDFESAASYYEKAGYPGKQAYIKIADSCYAEKNYEMAIKYYNKAGESEKAQGCCLKLIDVCLTKQDYNSAFKYFQDLGSSENDANIKIGDWCLSKKEYDSAIEYYKRAGHSEKEAIAKVKLVKLSELKHQVYSYIDKIPDCEECIHIELLVQLGIDYLEIEYFNETLAAFAIALVEYGRIANDLLGSTMKLYNEVFKDGTKNINYYELDRINREVKKKQAIAEVYLNMEFDNEIETIQKFIETKQAMTGITLLNEVLKSSKVTKNEVIEKYKVELTEITAIKDSEFLSKAIDYLTKMSKAENIRVRYFSLSGLALINNPIVVKPLIDNCDRYFFPSIFKRFVALKNEIYTDLMNGLQVGNPYTRSNIAFALGQIGDKNIKNELGNILNKELDKVVRINLIYALIMLGEKNMISDIVTGTKSMDNDVKLASIRAIQWLNVKGNIEVAVKDILPLLEDSDEDIRFFAAHVFAAMPTKANEDVVTKLVSLLDDEKKDVREASQNALSKMKTDFVISQIINIINSGNKNAKIGALAVLGKIGNQKHLSVILKHIKDEDIEIKRAAISSLGSLGSTESIEPLLNIIKTNDDLGTNAAFSLFSIKDLNYEYVKSSLINEKNLAAYFVLALLREDSGKLGIEKILRSGDINNRIQAANLASILRDNFYVDALKILSKHHDSYYYPTDLYARKAAWKAQVMTMLVAMSYN